MIKQFISLYLPNYPMVLVYMLQSTEYQVKPYLQWLWRTKDFTTVMQRRTLEHTKPARALLLAIYGGVLMQISAGVALIQSGLTDDIAGGIAFGAALILSYPIVWAYLLVLPLLLGRWFVTMPADQQRIAAAERIFAGHTGVKIAVVGSYGKTTMKELLSTVLGEGLKVAATPANKNVSSSHARFAQTLSGREDAVIIEYGEGAPGDVARFARYTHPTHAVITGVAPAHLDRYKTLKAAGEDIFSVSEFLDGKQVFVNNESGDARPFLKPEYQLFDVNGALGWRVSSVRVGFEGTSFTMSKAKSSIKLKSGLIGEHQVGFLAFAAALAVELGLTTEQVKAGVAKTQPFEHRMQPYHLGKAWIIDDTYNGNLEGVRAGTKLLKRLKADRKIYVTPGLVDQGPETERVHVEMGELIAGAKPAIVVLMKNSTTSYIKRGLEQGGYKGEVRIEHHPLDFYTNLAHFVAKGDLVLMQNDWPDSYA